MKQNIDTILIIDIFGDLGEQCYNKPMKMRKDTFMHNINIVGLGAGDVTQISQATQHYLLTTTLPIYLRTQAHPVVQTLQQQGMHYHSFDDIYESHDQFHHVYETIVQQLITAAQTQDIIYVVPGHALVAEYTVKRLIELYPDHIHFIAGGGQSFLDAMFTALHIDPIEGFQLLDGTDLNKHHLQPYQHVIIAQVYDDFVAGEVKLTLMDVYPDDHPITLISAAGSAQETQQTRPLYEMDFDLEVDNLRSVYVPPLTQSRPQDLTTLQHTIQRLANECPWHQAQDAHLLSSYLVEEAQEAQEAILADDDNHIIDELGDVLYNVLIQAHLGEQAGYFDLNDIIANANEKLWRRHPHVFSDGTAKTIEEVQQVYQQIKQQEGE